MDNTTITQQELQAFFSTFCEAFSKFSGELIAKRYATPYLAHGADGLLKSFATSSEISQYFQSYLNQYWEQGCRLCKFKDFNFLALGNHSALATITWQLLSESGKEVNSWRESYNILKDFRGLLIYASTDHVK
jgi:hypothetical protein